MCLPIWIAGLKMSILQSGIINLSDEKNYGWMKCIQVYVAYTSIFPDNNEFRTCLKTMYLLT